MGISVSKCAERLAMISIIGGTFDPIHFGHLRPALEIMEQFSLDECRFIPSANPPHRWQPQASAEHRLKMTALAIQGIKGFTLDDREYKRDGASYTVDTLKSIRNEIGNDVSLCMIIGLDAFQSFTQWRDWQTILTLTHLVVSSRPGYEKSTEDTWVKKYLTEDASRLKQEAAGRIFFAEVTQFDISATQIRKQLLKGHSASYLLPKSVNTYIDRHQLYRKDST